MNTRQSALSILIGSIIVVVSGNAFAAEKSSAVTYPATQWCIATPTLRVRDTPETEGEIVTKIPYGARVRVLQEQGDQKAIGGKTGKWVEVEFHGMTGYAFNAFLTSEEPVVLINKQKKHAVGILNSFDKECTMEFIDTSGKSFVENADNSLCKQEYLGKRLKLVYEAGDNGTILVKDVSVIPLR